MLTEEFIKKIHGTEIKWALNGLSHHYNAVVLASEEDGISIKPYFKDAKEKEAFILDWVANSDDMKDPKIVEEKIDAPTFCFAHYSRNFCFDNEVKDDIKNKGPVFISIVNNGSPVCPFA